MDGGKKTNRFEKSPCVDRSPNGVTRVLQRGNIPYCIRARAIATRNRGASTHMYIIHGEYTRMILYHNLYITDTQHYSRTYIKIYCSTRTLARFPRRFCPIPDARPRTVVIVFSSIIRVSARYSMRTPIYGPIRCLFVRSIKTK